VDIPNTSRDAPAGWPRGTVTMSTESVGDRDRFDYWHDVICRLYVQLEAHPLDPGARFAGDVTGLAAGPVQLTRVTSGPHQAERTRAAIARADDHYFLVSLVLDGTCVLIQDERTAVLRPGDFALYDTTRPYTLHFERDFGMLVLQMPQWLLQAVLPRAANATAATVDGAHGPAALVRPLLDGLVRTAGTASPASQRHLAAAAVELVAASLAETISLPADGPMRAAHRARAEDHIESHLGDPELSPETIARAVFVSPRYLHSLFHDAGTSVSRYVMDRRLDRAYHDLAQPGAAHLAVADIAARLGFKDASHFTRVFKARFAVSPRQHRNSVAAVPAPAARPV
jgi:AraC-like DNA-binding protein